MHTTIARIALALALLFAAAPAMAAPPGTITYQGTLGSADGQPVDGSVTITFRLYFGLADPSSYWHETHALDVEDGKFSVELGEQTPLPNELFGAPLYLGIQVQGDVEMTPRLRLSAAPYAFRARSLMRGTIHVPADGTPLDNGTALRAAIQSVAGAAADNRYVVSVDAGDFDLGGEGLVVPSYVGLVGAGPEATTLRAALAGPAVELHSHSALSSLGVVNSGGDGVPTTPNVAIGVADASTHVTLRSVRAAVAPPGGQDAATRIALRWQRTSHLLLTDVDLEAERGQRVYGIRSTFPQGEARASGIVLNDVRITGSAGTILRGIDLDSSMDVAVTDMHITLSGGGIAPSEVTAFRGQANVALQVNGLTVELDLADTTPEYVNAMSVHMPARLDLANFGFRIATGACGAFGHRAGLMLQTSAPEQTSYLQGTPRISNGRVDITSNDCAIYAIANLGSSPTLENVQVSASHSGTNGLSWGYTTWTTDGLCNDGHVAPEAAVLRNSSIHASSASGEANAVDVCTGTLAIENSTLYGDDSAFKGSDNEVAAYAFRIGHSRLGSTRQAALRTIGESQGTVVHAHLESPVSPVAAFADPATTLRSTMACLAATTPTSFSAGPACACTAGADCPATP